MGSGPCEVHRTVRTIRVVDASGASFSMSCSMTAFSRFMSYRPEREGRAQSLRKLLA